MKPTQLLQICLATSSSSTLFHYSRLNNIATALYSRRTSNSAAGRQRHRRALSAPSTPSHNQLSQRRRRRLIGQPSNCRSIERLLRPSLWADMGLERRLSRASPNTAMSLDAVLNASSIDLGSEDAMPATCPTPPSKTSDGDQVIENGSDATETTSAYMSPSQPPRATSETSETRSTRSASSASRNANRLSLTLPIALPGSFSSRPTPTSSMPPTPIDTLTLNSPIDSDDFIVAIAAQERRVLELREELARAEIELKRLKRQWTVSEGCKKRPPNTAAEPTRTLAPAAKLRDSYEDTTTARRSSELERRKAILLAQSQATPRQHKRTVIRGSHTRTLSLLSPTKSVGDAPIREDQDSVQSSHSYISQPLNKRATWAPYQSTQQSTGVKQLASDFKQGLWTFVEDLRQATVGDEAVIGTTNRTTEMGSRSAKVDGDQDTMRTSTTNRGRVTMSTETDSPSHSPGASSMSSSSDRFQHRRTASRPEPRARKHFSWTPLTFDNLDDADWSNWESPNAKTSRWSGSTVNGDIVPAIPETADETEVALRHKLSGSELQPSSPETPSGLENIPQAIFNRLATTSFKNTTSNFMREWEKSLSPRPQTASFGIGMQGPGRNT
ncbi:hypothetical protein F5Y14DRAFT_416975 [Nemania sp. NC0429]|nr:hypothetical protein F5Y14DRAFT_416975 [Nemania sp. NC0429]